MPKKKNRKLVVVASNKEIKALIGNHGAFFECAGFDEELIKINQRELSGGIKLHFTETILGKIYLVLQGILDSPRYPKKTSKEYESVISFKEKLAYECERQFGNKINT